MPILRRKKQGASSSLDLPQPSFLFLPSFPSITYHQRELLFKLVRLTREEGSYLGEFWWRSDPDEPNIVMQIKPRTTDGNFDPENPVFKGTQWSHVGQQAHMEVLDRLGYVMITPEREYGTKKEKWRSFAVNQIAFDFDRHAHRPALARLAAVAWDKAQNHLLALVFGVLGALLVELVKYLVRVAAPSQ